MLFLILTITSIFFLIKVFTDQQKRIKDLNNKLFSDISQMQQQLLNPKNTLSDTVPIILTSKLISNGNQISIETLKSELQFELAETIDATIEKMIEMKLIKMNLDTNTFKETIEVLK